MSKIIKLCKVPGDNLGASVSVPSTTRPINGEYQTGGPYTGYNIQIGTPSGGVFNWGTVVGTPVEAMAQIDALATALGTTVAGLVGKNVTSPNITGTKTILAMGYKDRGGSLQPSCWVSAVSSSMSGTVTFGGGTTGGGSTITARLKGASATKAVTKMKVHNDRSFRATNADGTSACKLVAADPASGEMNIIATDSTGNTYYVTRLFERLAIVTRKTGSSHQFATGSRVKWNESDAVLNVSVKV